MKFCIQSELGLSLLSSGGPGGYSNPLVFLALTGILAGVSKQALSNGLALAAESVRSESLVLYAGSG